MGEGNDCKNGSAKVRCAGYVYHPGIDTPFDLEIFERHVNKGGKV
jgi:hypothetical protein